MRARSNVHPNAEQLAGASRAAKTPPTSSHVFRKPQPPVNQVTRSKPRHGAGGGRDGAFRAEIPTLVDDVELETARLASMRDPTPSVADEIDVVWSPESEPVDPEKTYSKYVALLGAFSRVPVVTVSFDALRSLSMDSRMGFLIALIDGASTIETLLDVAAGMPPREVLHALVTLRDLGIVELREEWPPPR
jgi:hypothetical protein